MRAYLLMTTLALAGAALADEDPTDKELAKKPASALKGELGDLLRAWYKHDLAAGNVGDWYDNRDGEHSPLDLAAYPQLRKVRYSAEDRKARRDWAWQRQVLPHVVFGNSSTSGPPEMNGSNPRSFYCAPEGLRVLERQYLKNNLYIYPEHRDHDPGHNGSGGGFGDLYPTNTPYLLISQGSSGTDGPFMRALPTTLAAFRPDVKKKLIETGLLMPAVQMILRSTNNHLKGPGEYLTGKAHPAAFEGQWVEPVKMARLAQSIRLTNIPPLVKLKVVEEDKPEAGRDYFDRPGATEQLADTSSVIARVWRGQQYKRRMVVSARDSVDVNKSPLKWTWVLLRGDPKRVTITPRGKAGDEAEIVVSYHERRPVAPGSALESNRVEVGVFAHNGTFYSAPAFVTFFTLDSESRAYDDKGRVVEIAYGMGTVELTLADAAGAMAELGKEGLAAKVLALTAAQRADLAKVAKALPALVKEVGAAREKREAAEKAANNALDKVRDAEKALAEAKKGKKETDITVATRALAGAKAAFTLAQKESATAGATLTGAQAALDKLLDGRREALGDGARPFVLNALRAAARRPTMWNDHASALGALAGKAKRVAMVRSRLHRLGVAKDAPNKVGLILHPVRQGPGKETERLTAFERGMLEQLHAVVLADVLLPGKVKAESQLNLVDARLTVLKPWRDVYRHDGDKVAGWTRYHLSERPLITEHTPEGWWVFGKDATGRPTKARTVAYRQVPGRKGWWINDAPLTMTAGDEEIAIGYEGKKRVVKREKVGKE